MVDKARNNWNGIRVPKVPARSEWAQEAEWGASWIQKEFVIKGRARVPPQSSSGFARKIERQFQDCRDSHPRKSAHSSIITSLIQREKRAAPTHEERAWKLRSGGKMYASESMQARMIERAVRKMAP